MEGMHWYVARGDHAEGPYDADQVCDLFLRGDLQLDDRACLVGGTEWLHVRDLPIIAVLLPPPLGEDPIDLTDALIEEVPGRRPNDGAGLPPATVVRQQTRQATDIQRDPGEAHRLHLVASNLGSSIAVPTSWHPTHEIPTPPTKPNHPSDPYLIGLAGIILLVLVAYIAMQAMKPSAAHAAPNNLDGHANQVIDESPTLGRREWCRVVAEAISARCLSQDQQTSAFIDRIVQSCMRAEPSLTRPADECRMVIGRGVCPWPLDPAEMARFAINTCRSVTPR